MQAIYNDYNVHIMSCELGYKLMHDKKQTKKTIF